MRPGARLLPRSGLLASIVCAAAALAVRAQVPHEPIEIGDDPHHAGAEAAREREVDDGELVGVESDRGLERFRYDCRADIDRRDITLFANGTLRLKQGEPGNEAMWLLELRPEERDGYLARLRGDNREESEQSSETVGGDWIARCRLMIHLPGELPEEYDVGRFDSLSLGLQRAVAVAEELVARVDTSTPPEGSTRLPLGYRPEIGDELRRPDGAWFRVDGYTTDGNGVELSGLEHPLVLYTTVANLEREFVELRRRERFRR